MAYAIIYEDYLISLGKGTSALTTMSGTMFCAMSFACVFASAFFKRFSLRSVGLFGGFIYFLGSFLIVFSTSVEQLLVSQSIMQGKMCFKIKSSTIFRELIGKTSRNGIQGLELD